MYYYDLYYKRRAQATLCLYNKQLGNAAHNDRELVIKTKLQFPAVFLNGFVVSVLSELGAIIISKIKQESTFDHLMCMYVECYQPVIKFLTVLL